MQDTTIGKEHLFQTLCTWLFLAVRIRLQVFEQLCPSLSVYLTLTLTQPWVIELPRRPPPLRHRRRLCHHPPMLGRFLVLLKCAI
jgi:hypothetical protein